MMNQKNLVKLGVVTVVAVVAALAINRSRQPVNDFSERANALVTDLADHVNDVSKLTLSTANAQKVVELERTDKGWVVKESGGYPADVGKLREYLLRLADANLLERKTADKARYADLGVSDISEPTAKGVQVQIDGLASPLTFIAGNFNAQAGGTFVRRSGEEPSWLAKGNLIPDKNPSDWLKKDLANIPSDRIASVTITHADGKSLRVFKNTPKDSTYTIADLPKGREPASDFTANGLASVLADLRIEDVAPSSEVAPSDNATRIRYQTFDGVVVEAKEWQVGEKHYATFVASLDGDAADRHIAEEQAASAGGKSKNEAKEAAEAPGGDASKDSASEAEAKPAVEVDPAKDREQRLAALEQEVAALNDAFAGWSFVVPAYKSGNMTKSMDDMLKPLEEKAAGKSTPPAKSGH